MSAPAEYRAARSALLDALLGLGGQIDSVVVVGAQAIYLHLGDTDTGINAAPTTTDGDLALDAEILAPHPNLTGALEAAGFTLRGQPGTWTNAAGISVDLMICPHQSGRDSPTARSARLAPYGHPEKHTARITPGLEPALVDHKPMTLRAFDEHDDRTVTVKVAGPAAMLVAKLIKMQERLDDRRAGRPDRVRSKDVIDIFRLLVGTLKEDISAGLALHQQSPHAAVTSDAALTFASQDLNRPGGSEMRSIFAVEVGHDPIQLAQWDALLTELAVFMR